jgi:hypothetical protein
LGFCKAVLEEVGAEAWEGAGGGSGQRGFPGVELVVKAFGSSHVVIPPSGELRHLFTEIPFAVMIASIVDSGDKANRKNLSNWLKRATRPRPLVG